MDAIILTAVLRTILNVTTVWNNVETSDIYTVESEMGDNLDFECLIRSWVANAPDFEGIWNPEAQPFEI